MLLKGLAASATALALALPVAAASTATPPPGTRIDLRVLLLSADGAEPGFGAWKAALEREGVPYDAIVADSAPELTQAQLFDGDHARYQAVILASGDLGRTVSNPNGTTSFLSALSDREWDALATLERTFAIRRLSDYTAPSPARGLNTAPGATQDGVAAVLTATGRQAFGYLRGPVTIADDDPAAAETFGYPATPVAGAAWQTLLAAPNGSALLGIYTHADGREEMVMTVAGNQFQNHVQLLRHGMLNWVTRGVFLGHQRHYLALHIDDLFLSDDAWDPDTNTTSYDPARASRMTPADVDRAIAWSRERGLRLDMVFNGAGSAREIAETGSDPLAARFADPAVRSAFGYVNHTYEHPNLDCSTGQYIRRQIEDNAAWARTRGLPFDPAELVTGEHSGLANARPGSPGTIDPPGVNDIELPAGGTLPAGTYDYALTARSAAGETTPTIVSNVAATGSVRVSFDAVCHAVGFDLYRRPTGGAWARVGTFAWNPTAATDDGDEPITLSILDAGGAGAAAEPPAANGATLAPYGQNPAFLDAVSAAGITTVATDASKDYPPAGVGAFWAQGPVRAIPRYPSNVYYNVSRQGQQLDEYNWIYVDPAHGGGCVPIAGVTTCRTTPATWDEYVTSETRVMFRHLAGNDPRPHFFHQSNLADHNPALPVTHPDQGGILYPVMDALVGRYEAAFDRAVAPLVQPTQTQAGIELARQAAWAQSAGTVTAWLQDGRVHVRNDGPAAVEVPLTGTVGEPYAGQRSGWVTVAPGATASFAPSDPAATAAPTVRGTARVGETLRSTSGTWTGTAPITVTRQWQRCQTQCVNIAGATGATYTLTEADRGRRMRLVVTAGNWISSVSQSISAQTATVAARPSAPRDQGSPPGSGGQGQQPAGRRDDTGSHGGPPPGAQGGPGARGGRRPARLRLTRVTMSPRRFAVSHRRPRRGTRLDGARVSWRLNRPARVRLTFQTRARGRWKTVGRITRRAPKGTGVLRFRGRFGSRLLAPRRYRLRVSASAGGQRTPARTLRFRVVRG